MKLIAFFIAIWLITACSTNIAQPTETINELIIENHTSTMVSNVRLSVPSSHRFVSCGIILPQSQCALGFPETENRQDPATLSWENNGQIYQQSLAEAVMQSHIKEDRRSPAKIAILLKKNGRVIIEKR